MKLGLQISSFTWPGGPEAIGPTLARIVRQADDIGLDSIWVMDHFFQIRSVGPAEEPMLEGMTALGFMAAHSSRARLGLMVGGVHYRNPALWVKATTTLDVLSGGRAWLGIGAAWNEQESRGLGFPFPPLGERFEMLEETLQIAHAMWTGERGTEGEHRGRHFQARAPAQLPAVAVTPPGPDHDRRRRREEDPPARGPVRRCHATSSAHPRASPASTRSSPSTAPRSAATPTRSSARPSRTSTSPASRRHSVVDHFGELSDAGAQHVIFGLRDAHDPANLETIGRDIVPQLRGPVRRRPRPTPSRDPAVPIDTPWGIRIVIE